MATFDMPTNNSDGACYRCGEPVYFEHRINYVAPLIRHHNPTNCSEEGMRYDITMAAPSRPNAYTVAYPEPTSHVNITRDTYATLANAPTIGGASLTLGNIRQLYNQINPTQEMAARVVGNNTEILHRHGVRIVNGKIASIMDVDDETDW